MGLEFHKVTEFERGILHRLLVEGYSFDSRWKDCFEQDWKEFDDFFFDNPAIADKYGFVTVLDGRPIGHISWDPRNRPDYVEVGHNCIIPEYKGKGYGHRQLAEAIRRIQTYDVDRITVFTNEALIPAQRNYESVGFQLVRQRENTGKDAFSGAYLYYEIVNKKITLCGDNCLECPRYLAHTEEEKERVAKLWHRVGWRDHVVSNEEISCTGCSSHKQCTYKLVECIKEHQVTKCNECSSFPCEKINDMLERSKDYQKRCQKVCTADEYNVLAKAFFDKEANLRR